ncbi:MAG: YheU family protein [Gammaproteobacteria bacterium]|nr:YheU family protein [Gammaproteobacteria bacterium]
MVKIPTHTLSPEALRGVVEAFVLREGTDYGHRDISLEEKCAAVERQIAAGQAEVWFDPATGTTDIREPGDNVDKTAAGSRNADARSHETQGGFDA